MGQVESVEGGDTSPFGPWWNDPKKHAKRVRYWLPHIKAIAERLESKRSFRYFSLCARHMIDVFMLLDANILSLDKTANAIEGVQYCEAEEKDYTEIGDILKREDSGFFGRLEQVALFEDDDYTARFSTRDEIAAEREREGEDLAPDKIDRLALKETSLLFQESFPYDFVNLDFCDYYYASPPEEFTITKTVAAFLKWQRNVSRGARPVAVDEFVLAVTCRYDDTFPEVAEEFLTKLVRSNCEAFEDYRTAFDRSRGTTLEQWIHDSREDLFLTAWPKHIAEEGAAAGWGSQVLDYVYYHRPPGSSGPYIMICLVVRFKRDPRPNDLATALHVLDQENRVYIDDFEWKSDAVLWDNFKRIRSLRNERARTLNLLELPDID